METFHYNDDKFRYFPYDIPIMDRARKQFEIDTLDTSKGQDAPFRFARTLAARMNEGCDFSTSTASPARSGELLAIMLLHEISHHLIRSYCRKVNPNTIENALSHVRKTRGVETVNNMLPAYVRYYPPVELRKKTDTAEAFLAGETHSITHVELTFTEILVVQMAHENPAMHPYCSLFDNGALRSTTPYDALLEGLEEWFDTQPAGPDSGLTLFHLLREPFLHNPDSLKEQLEYIKLRWHAWLPPEMLKRLLVAQDALREETLMRGFGPGPVDALSFDTQDYDEPEAFSRDEDWMPRVVLVAKLAYVWLDQLSIKYGRTLTRLDDIPNEELDQMAQWGFNALWLIGVWERSPASSDIKQRMGNPEAAASAYSLYDYDIAAELGGEKAYQDLAHRAEQRGIRLAGDMVPNHVGLYSRWVIEHPDWFVQLHEPPFPGYKFTGPDLSREKGISLFIEDGYWDHSDAAVVFKHVDTHTGTVRYLYHGNDGTSMPWNDTAQLNFTLPEVREAVIKAIIHVARMFPIIRFDAAMTLAKRHYQRLWFPRPGEGGAIPSRAEYGIDKAAFDDVFPMEFWREVVDRIAVEAPDTLLLAEAFWLMEGYFVRTLGMHRVYNSAFMNMLKEEDNANYRKTLKNVLEFSPAILQRFVNFMNNPDEDTAQEQFGKDDKYFGVAAMLVTMPGLPMFGHGQIEGFTEKYGMEYRRAYYQETPDKNLIDRHKREIFPLMRKRYLFSDATNFALFDFTTAEGWVNENVYAYTNRTFDEQALIVYNNAYDTTQGVLHTSTAINEGNAEEPQLQRRTLTDALALNTDPRYYAILRDERSGLEYLRHNATIAEVGLHFELDAYEYKAFITIRQVCDNDRTWGRLHALLGSKGVPDMEEAYIEMYLSDILNPFRELMKIEMVDHVLTTTDMDNILGPWRTKMSEFLTAISDFTKQPRIAETILEEMTSGLQKLRTFMTAPTLETLPETVNTYLQKPLPLDHAALEEQLSFWRPFAVCCLLRSIGKISQPEANRETMEIQSASWMRSWLLVKHIGRMLEESRGDSRQAQQDARMVYACVAQRTKLIALSTNVWGPLLYDLFEDTNTRSLLQINIFSKRRWMNKECLERLLHTLFLLTAFDSCSGKAPETAPLIKCYMNIQDILNAASDTNYDFDWMLEALK